MDHAVKLTINGETREFPMGITYKEVVKEYEKTSPAPVILVIAGGKICELHKKAERDGEVRLVTTKDSIGNKTYKRTACLVLLKAIYDLAGKEKVDKVVLHYSVGSGFYFTMAGEQKLDQAFLDQVKKRMTELDSVIASLTEQLKESISISAEELNAQKKNFAQQKKSLSENRDEIHARLEINSDMYEKIRRQQTELLKTETRWKWMKSLSDTANGTITGKARIMLETYIQMQYFDRILARANIRLMTMSSGQYELVRRKENKSRVGKTGLELDVVDHYNGTVRSVKTLSGGETFQASLSLALGLSDEIQSSSGGIQLDTMFVDEGFGSLDEDALDQAIRALKDLSQGSRLVGIVSHVAELKERIDKKIIVTKKRTEDGVGSTICIEG